MDVDTDQPSIAIEKLEYKKNNIIFFEYIKRIYLAN